MRSDAAKKALKLADEKLRRSSHHKNPVIRHGYNECMVRHYAYMKKVAEVRELESYAGRDHRMPNGDQSWRKKCGHLMPTRHRTWLTLPNIANISDANGCTR